jgi:hypothetical protein
MDNKLIKLTKKELDEITKTHWNNGFQIGAMMVFFCGAIAFALGYWLGYA